MIFGRGIRIKNERSKSKSEADETFDRMFLSAVEESMDLLGEAAKTAIFFLLKEQAGIRREDVPKKPREFAYALRRILGNIGSRYVEELIIRALYSKLGYNYEKSGGKEFHEYVEEARRKFKSMKQS